MAIQPPLAEAPRYPITSLIALGAIAVSVYWWTGHPIEAMVPKTGTLVARPWTLLSSALPHVNVLHLFFNLSWWWLLGSRLERALGAVRAVGIVVVLAMISGGAEFAFEDGGVGLSGVVYGLCTFIWVAQRRIPALEGTVGKKTLQLFAVWFVVCIVLTVAGIMRVGNVAHGMGAVAGWVIGQCFAADRRRVVWFGVLVVLAAAVGIGATVGRPYVNIRNLLIHDSYRGYQALQAKKYDEAARYLEAAVKRHPENTTDLVNLGSAYMGLKRYPDALAKFREAAWTDPSLRPRLVPTVVSILDNQAAEMLKKKDVAGAKAAIAEALEWNAEDEYAKRMVDWIKLAERTPGTLKQELMEPPSSGRDDGP